MLKKSIGNKQHLNHGVTHDIGRPHHFVQISTSALLRSLSFRVTNRTLVNVFIYLFIYCERNTGKRIVSAISSGSRTL